MTVGNLVAQSNVYPNGYASWNTEGKLITKSWGRPMTPMGSPALHERQFP